jgi:hypothetical protein
MVAHANAPDIVGASELDRAAASGFRSQPIDPARDATLNRAVELRHFPPGRGQYLDSVHSPACLQAETRFQVIPSDTLEVRRIGQGCPDIVEVALIL